MLRRHILWCERRASRPLVLVNLVGPAIPNCSRLVQARLHCVLHEQSQREVLLIVQRTLRARKRVVSQSSLLHCPFHDAGKTPFPY